MLTATQSLAASTWVTPTGPPLLLSGPESIQDQSSDEGLQVCSNPKEVPTSGFHSGQRHRPQNSRGKDDVFLCVCVEREGERATRERKENRTTHPEDSEAQDSQPILLTCHTTPALGTALPNCSAC